MSSTSFTKRLPPALRVIESSSAASNNANAYTESNSFVPIRISTVATGTDEFKVNWNDKSIYLGNSSSSNSTNGEPFYISGNSAALTQPAANQLMVKLGTAPAAHIDDYIFLGAKNASSSSEATLELTLEEDPVADTDIMQSGDPASHKLKVWINGTEYYIALKSV